MALFLEFECTQAEPPLEDVFLARGGAIAGAAARGKTDFATTGSEKSVDLKLHDTVSSTVRLALAPIVATVVDGDVVEVCNRTKLLLCNSRVGASINGSLVESVAGQAVVYLSALLREQTTQIPLTYSAWKAHSSVLCVRDPRIVDADGRKSFVKFVKDDAKDSALGEAETIMSTWAEDAWAMRTGDVDGCVVYPLSAGLTKSLATVPAGINDSKFDLVHNVTMQELPYSWKTIESLLEQAIKTELGQVPKEIDAFVAETSAPGLCAANHGRTLAASLSIIASFLVSYSADGRTAIMPDQSKSVETESWLRQAPRTPLEANDCDGSAILTSSLARTISSVTPEVARLHPFVGACQNVLRPHYTVGVCVLGACSAEASSGGAGGAQVAGHAASLMIPTNDLLLALEKGAGATPQPNSGSLGGEAAQAAHDAIAEARFAACFSAEIVEQMPEGERAALRSWAAAKAAREQDDEKLRPFAIEGTTPASPLLHETGDAMIKAARISALDKEAFQKAAPNIGRSIKILHASPKHTHEFYHDFCEFNLHREHPLWKSPDVRSLNAACTQIVLAKERAAEGEKVSVAGVTPCELVNCEFAAVPLVTVGTVVANTLDYASEIADLDVMPARESCGLDSFESARLSESLASLKNLSDKLSLMSAETAKGHGVAYIIAFSSLVNNPVGVKHLCSKLTSIASAGVVDSLDIEGLAHDSNGKSAGKLVVLNVYVP